MQLILLHALTRNPQFEVNHTSGSSVVSIHPWLLTSPGGFVQLVCAAVSYAVAIVVTAMAARSLLSIWYAELAKV